jgi:hypothetical protein
MARRLLCAIVFFLAGVMFAWSRDIGQWGNADPATRSWYEHLMMPDHPAVSCCREADAYYADIAETDAAGDLIAVITDDRPDEPLGRVHVPVGTRFIIPQSKIKFDQGNPTGHIVIFLGMGETVLCYVQNGGV